MPDHENFTLAGNINVMDCYMGSTTGGSEGDAAAVSTVLTALTQLGTFEVAFGGGEPSTWPHLTQVLQFARSVGSTPNSTTKSYPSAIAV